MSVGGNEQGKGKMGYNLRKVLMLITKNIGYWLMKKGY